MKTTVGELLAARAQAQGSKLVDIPGAAEIYTHEWALNTVVVTKLLLGDQILGGNCLSPPKI